MHFFYYRYSQIRIKKNKSPAQGQCSIPETEFYCLTTLFAINCNSWIDPEDMGIESYSFFYITHNEDGTTARSTMASSSVDSIQAVLPLGTFTIGVVIKDILQAETEYMIKNITTIMPDKATYDNFNASQRLQAYAASGDNNMVSMLAVAMNSIRENANWTSLNPSDLDGKSDEEVQALLVQLSESTGQQLDSLKGSSTPTDISQVNIMGGVLTSAVGSVLKNDMASYTLDIKTRQDSTDILNNMANSLDNINVGSPSQYEEFFSSALLTMVALTKATNIVIENNERAPPSDVLIASTMEYDSGDFGDDPNVQTPLDKEEMYKRNVLELTKKQCEEQTARFKAITDKFCRLMKTKLVVGEIHATRTNEGATLIVGNIDERILAKGFKINEGNLTVQLPNHFCPSQMVDPKAYCKSTFTVCIMVWPVTTHFFADSRVFLSKSSYIVDLDITSDDKLVDVRNLRRPIKITVPRAGETLSPPVQVNVTDIIDPYQNLVYHYFNVSVPGAAYQIEITPSVASDNLVLLIDYERYPIPGQYLQSYFIHELPSANGVHRAFVNTKENANREGGFIAAVGRLKNNAHHSNFTKSDVDQNFDSNYDIRIIVLGCFYFNNTLKEWTGDSHLGALGSNKFTTTCETNHLTSFGTGFIPIPNKVDFELIIANAGITDNSTLYIVMAVLLLMYIIMLIWGHYKDKKDMERRGAIPLPDNKIEDKYIYEITIHTGPDSDAPCESNIFVIVSGDFGETEIRKLPPPTLNLYRRYDRNVFVMTTAEPLGPIRYLRIFHDNSGRPPYSGWQVDRAIVRDLQKAEYYYFEINAWLSFDRDDGQVDKTFLCSNNTDDEISFSQKMYNQSQRGTNQDNMWLSIFLRPIGSRFSRKERVTVCAVFLYLTMLVSAMYYQVEGNTPRESGYSMGPITFSVSQVVTGLYVLIIIFPLTLILISAFKRARPRELYRCRALEALEQQRMRQLVKEGEDEETAAEESRIVEVDGEHRQKEKTLVKCLPWWTRTLAWVVSLICILGSAFFVFAYGITWGEITTTKWFASFFVTFAISILVAQWLKVGLMSCFASCTDTNLSIEDMDCDEELPNLKQDEKWLHMVPLAPSAPRKVHRVRGVEGTKRDLRKLRINLTKDREMKFVVRGIMMYCVFLVVLLIVVGDRTDINAFLMQRHLTRTFIKPGHLELDLSTKV